MIELMELKLIIDFCEFNTLTWSAHNLNSIMSVMVLNSARSRFKSPVQEIL